MVNHPLELFSLEEKAARVARAAFSFSHKIRHVFRFDICLFALTIYSALYQPNLKAFRSRPLPKDKKTTKIQLIAEAEAQGAAAEAYQDWIRKTGRKEVPSILKCFAARPDFFRQVVEFSDSLHFSEGHLSRRHKEMIATYVSVLNHCPY